MLRHLRLARDRGSLTAPNGRVQDRALEYLSALEEYDAEQSRMDSVKRLLATAPYERVRALFPEYFDPYGGAVDEEGNFDIDKVDDSQIDWGTPGSQDDDEALSRWIAEREVGSVSAADFE